MKKLIMRIGENYYYTEDEEVFCVNYSERKITNINNVMGYCGELFKQLMKENEIDIMDQSSAEYMFAYEYGIEEMNDLSALIKMFQLMPTFTLERFNELLESMDFEKVSL